MLQPGPEIPDSKMFIRARNAVWMSKRTIGIRGFRGLVAAVGNSVLAIAELSRTITRFHQNDDSVVQAMRTFQTTRQNCQPRIQVEISE